MSARGWPRPSAALWRLLDEPPLEREPLEAAPRRSGIATLSHSPPRLRPKVQRAMSKNPESNEIVDEAAPAAVAPKLKSKEFEKELYELQVELTRLQAWAVAERARVIVVFEGRDTAGKGGVIKRIT